MLHIKYSIYYVKFGNHFNRILKLGIASFINLLKIIVSINRTLRLVTLKDTYSVIFFEYQNVNREGYVQVIYTFFQHECKSTHAFGKNVL